MAGRVAAAPGGPTRLEAHGLAKAFYGHAALDDLSLDVVGGEVHGLLGENGAGKTTLCSILAGLYRPDRGRLVLDGRELRLRSPHDATSAGIGMVHQHFRLVERFTVGDNLLLGVHHAVGAATRRALARRVHELGDEYGMDVDPTQPVWQLSVGERQRVEILRQLVRGARVLILDEPTAVLGPSQTDQLFATVRHLTDLGHAVVLVSHKLDEVLAHTDRVTVLRHGRRVGGGPTSGFGPSALAALMFGSSSASESVTVGGAASPGDVVLDVRALDVRGDRGPLAVEDVSLSVRRGQIVGVAGVAGNGQRELHETIAGLRRPAGGTIGIAGRDVTGSGPAGHARAGLAYVPDDRLGVALAPGLPAEENLVLKGYDRSPHAAAGVLRPAATKRAAAALAEQFDVRGARAGMPVSFMSGGNQQKLILARELSQSHEVLVTASPARGLDLAATRAVRTHLVRERDEGRGVLLFSDDLNEILDLSDVVLVMFRGRVRARYDRGDGPFDLERIGLAMTGAVEVPA